MLPGRATVNRGLAPAEVSRGQAMTAPTSLLTYRLSANPGALGTRQAPTGGSLRDRSPSTPPWVWAADRALAIRDRPKIQAPRSSDTDRRHRAVSTHTDRPVSN